MSKEYVLDLVERVFFTWLEAFLGILIAVQFTDLVDVDAWKAAAIAGIPAALAVLKGGIAKFANNPNTAGFVNTAPPTVTPIVGE